eukprot:5235366-Ditylum_brightwellii.AAC.1
MDTGKDMEDRYTHRTVEETLQVKGDEAVDCLNKFVTPTSINFVMPKGQMSYPIRQEFVALIHMIQKEDPTLTVKETLGEA